MMRGWGRAGVMVAIAAFVPADARAQAADEPGIVADEPGVAGQPTPAAPPTSQPSAPASQPNAPTSAPASKPTGAHDPFLIARTQCKAGGGTCVATPALMQRLYDPTQRAAAAATLGELADPRAITPLAHLGAYGDTEPIRNIAAAALAQIARNPAARNHVRRTALTDADPKVRRVARHALRLGGILGMDESPPTAAPADGDARIARRHRPAGTRYHNPLRGDKTRVTLGPSAVMRPAGTLNWRMINIGLHEFDFAPTDYLEVGVTAFLPVGVVVVSPQVKIGKTFGRFSVGAYAQGGVVSHFVDNRDDWRSGFYGGGPIVTYVGDKVMVNVSMPLFGLTIVERQSSTALLPGLGTGFPTTSSGRETVTEHHWFMVPNVGISVHPWRYIKLNFEVFLPFGDIFERQGAQGAIVYGMRIFGAHLYGDVGFVLPIWRNADELLQFMPLGLPLLSLGYQW